MALKISLSNNTMLKQMCPNIVPTLQTSIATKMKNLILLLPLMISQSPTQEVPHISHLKLPTGF